MINKLIYSIVIGSIFIGNYNVYSNEYQHWAPVVSYHTQYVPVTVQVPVIQHYSLPVYTVQHVVYEYRPWFNCFKKQQYQYWINQAAPPVMIYPYNVVKY